MPLTRLSYTNYLFPQAFHNIDMEDLVGNLRKVGLTEYEAKTYLGLLTDHLNTATKLAEKSGVPRTKIYSVLESLREKGWVRIYSGVPLLFRAINPDEVISQVKESHDAFLEPVQRVLSTDVNGLKEKFVIRKEEIGLTNVKEEISKAKTVYISNATTELLERLEGSFSEDAEIRAIMYPGEKEIKRENIRYKEADVEIVSILKNQEVPNMSIILDEDRTFTIVKDPVTERYVVDEMLYDECSNCFLQWYQMGWSEEEAN